jgi:ectoine hydroxylase-related dioxygenase (phytanoyl-CoA dioxygenase family)
VDPLEEYACRGSFRIEGFAEPAVAAQMRRRVVELVRAAEAGETIAPAFVMLEQQPGYAATRAVEDRVSKVFRLHREPVFHRFATRADVLALVRSVLGVREVDCFLSQFIFKNPGAWGQPWHQDSLYFPFDRKPQIGLWLAITEATLENGVLHVLPGSHREPVHPHVRDARPGAIQGYMEIVDHDMSGSVPVLMAPGDLLIFHGHLMHRSTDNVSRGRRAAMVFHFSEHGTRDLNPNPTPVQDWMPLREPAQA